MSDRTPVGMWLDVSSRRLCCDWGLLTHTAARFDRDPIEVGPTILTTEDYAARLAMYGPVNMRGALCTVELAEGRAFWHADAHGQRWTWELFSARWTDRPDDRDWLIGRWPD